MFNKDTQNIEIHPELGEESACEGDYDLGPGNPGN